jgi:hypothetical protein
MEPQRGSARPGPQAGTGRNRVAVGWIACPVPGVAREPRNPGLEGATPLAFEEAPKGRRSAGLGPHAPQGSSHKFRGEKWLR